MFTYQDRADAGRALAGLLEALRGRDDAIVLALPRGGVAVAAEIARHLALPLDVLGVRKIGVPSQPEIAAGAIATGGQLVWNESVLDGLGCADDPERALAEPLWRERAELARREAVYREGRPPLDLAGRVVILVDDGLATGSTMLAAARAVRAANPRAIIAAVPVAPPDVVDLIGAVVDQVVCPLAPPEMHSIGSWYREFDQLEDDDVRNLLRAAAPLARSKHSQAR